MKITEQERIIKLMEFVRVFLDFSKELKTDHQIKYRYDKGSDKDRTWVDIDGVVGIRYTDDRLKGINTPKDGQLFMFHLYEKYDGVWEYFSSSFIDSDRGMLDASLLCFGRVMLIKAEEIFQKKEKKLKKLG